ncbi:DUF1259 domain-containing protein [Streptomyces sp. NPDC052107]|uniref:DUF1259 domain-containing protein n=1 Tax=Streptomyces sp. NPDC052107 TaxID=3155632 RepID=UPI0034283774
MNPPGPASTALAPSPGRPASDTDSDHLAIVLHRLHTDPRIRQEEQLFQPEQYLAHSPEPSARTTSAPPVSRRSRRDLQQGRQSQGVGTSLSRPGARCRDCSRSVSPDLSPNPPCVSRRNGITTGINFQPLGGNKAAINGDFVMTAPEVQKVIQALRKGNIDIVELHHHSLTDHPRLFYLHYWATADGVTLAKALRPAVDATEPAPAS